MCLDGAAHCIMGNHEYNAIGWVTPDPTRPGQFRRAHDDHNLRQHAAFLQQAETAPLRYRDISLAYFSYDLGQYGPGSPRLRKTLSLLEEVRVLAGERGLALHVVLLPCEPQLREAPPADASKPQRLVGSFLAGKQMEYLDLAEAFRRAGRPSRELFLYADYMHLSPAGHAIVFQAVLEDLPGRVDRAGAGAGQLPGAPVAVRRGSPK